MLRTLATKLKINKWDYIKLKNFSTAKETIYKMERQLWDWEKIFANHLSDKELVSYIYHILYEFANCIDAIAKQQHQQQQITWLKNGQKT